MKSGTSRNKKVGLLDTFRSVAEDGNNNEEYEQQNNTTSSPIAAGGNNEPKREVIFEGVLMKEGEKVKSWRSRYSLLFHDCLEYYQVSQQEVANPALVAQRLSTSKPKGKILLGRGVQVGEAPERGVALCFKIITPSRCYYLVAQNAELLQTWISKIRGVLLHYNLNRGMPSPAANSSMMNTLNRRFSLRPPGAAGTGAAASSLSQMRKKKTVQEELLEYLSEQFKEEEYPDINNEVKQLQQIITNKGSALTSSPSSSRKSIASPVSVRNRASVNMGDLRNNIIIPSFYSASPKMGESPMMSVTKNFLESSIPCKCSCATEKPDKMNVNLVNYKGALYLLAHHICFIGSLLANSLKEVIDLRQLKSVDIENHMMHSEIEDVNLVLKTVEGQRYFYKSFANTGEYGVFITALKSQLQHLELKVSFNSQTHHRTNSIASSPPVRSPVSPVSPSRQLEQDVAPLVITKVEETEKRQPEPATSLLQMKAPETAPAPQSPAPTPLKRVTTDYQQLFQKEFAAMMKKQNITSPDEFIFQFYGMYYYTTANNPASKLRESMLSDSLQLAQDEQPALKKHKVSIGMVYIADKHLWFSGYQFGYHPALEAKTPRQVEKIYKSDPRGRKPLKWMISLADIEAIQVRLHDIYTPPSDKDACDSERKDCEIEITVRSKPVAAEGSQESQQASSTKHHLVLMKSRNEVNYKTFSEEPQKSTKLNDLNTFTDMGTQQTIQTEDYNTSDDEDLSDGSDCGSDSEEQSMISNRSKKKQQQHPPTTPTPPALSPSSSIFSSFTNLLSLDLTFVKNIRVRKILGLMRHAYCTFNNIDYTSMIGPSLSQIAKGLNTMRMPRPEDLKKSFSKIDKIYSFKRRLKLSQLTASNILSFDELSDNVVSPGISDVDSPNHQGENELIDEPLPGRGSLALMCGHNIRVIEDYFESQDLESDLYSERSVMSEALSVASAAPATATFNDDEYSTRSARVPRSKIVTVGETVIQETMNRADPQKLLQPLRRRASSGGTSLMRFLSGTSVGVEKPAIFLNDENSIVLTEVQLLRILVNTFSKANVITTTQETEILVVRQSLIDGSMQLQIMKRIPTTSQSVSMGKSNSRHPSPNRDPFQKAVLEFVDLMNMDSILQDTKHNTFSIKFVTNTSTSTGGKMHPTETDRWQFVMDSSASQCIKLLQDLHQQHKMTERVKTNM